MTLILTLVITLTLSSPDASYIAALACGESCGMGQEPLELIIANLLYDQAEHGTDWLPRRWYALPRYNTGVEALVWDVLDNPTWPQCRLIGSIKDELYWKANGYLDANAVPDFAWDAGGLGVRAFGCRAVQMVFAPVECVRERCPE